MKSKLKIAFKVLLRRLVEWSLSNGKETVILIDNQEVVAEYEVDRYKVPGRVVLVPDLQASFVGPNDPPAEQKTEAYVRVKQSWGSLDGPHVFMRRR